MPADSHLHSPTPEEIMAYLDGETPVASRAVIATHLANCKECAMVADTFRRLSSQTSAWSVDPAPPSLSLPDTAAAPSASGRLLAWRPTRRLMTGLGIAAALLLVVSIREMRGGKRAVDVLASAPRERVGDVAGGLAAQPSMSPVPLRSSGQATGIQEQAAPATAGEPVRAPSIIRTASLQIVAKEFGGVRAAVEGLVTQAGGFIDQMTITGDTSTARVLRGTLRVPGERLADTVSRLRQLGQVVEDTQGSQDVTDQIVDLDARLVSARATEQRLTDLLRNRTGKLSDVLDVERELARVRLDIERLDAEKTGVGRRVSYATISVVVSEERKASLEGPLSFATRLRVAAADGLEAAFESVTIAVLFLLRAGPTLLLWTAALVGAWLLLRRRARPGLKG